LTFRLPQVRPILYFQAANSEYRIQQPKLNVLSLQCDPLAELKKQNDATMSVAAWSSLGLVNHLPNAGLTIYMPSDQALANLMKITGQSKGQARSLAETWPTIPTMLQGKIISIFMNHITYTVNADSLNGGADVVVPTALSLAHPGFALTLSKGGREVKTPAKQVVNVGEARMVCGNLLYVSPQILMPANLLALPDTPLQQALDIGRQMAASATAQV
jgi:hypothetical protein